MEVNNAVKTKISVDANGANLAFNLLRTTGSDSYYPAYSFQNDFSGGSGQKFNTDFSFTDESPLSYKSWSAEDDIQRKNCAQTIPQNRNLTDGNGCGSDTDLCGLVSTILEEAEPVDSYFSQEMSSGLKSLWSPKSMKEENLRYLNSSVTINSSNAMLPIQLCPDSLSNTHTQPLVRESRQNPDINQFSAGDPSWFSLSYNGHSEANRQPVQDLPRPPPGLSIPSENSYCPFKSRATKSDYGMPGKGGSFSSCNDTLSKNMDPCYVPNNSFFSTYQDFAAKNGPKMQNSTSFSIQNGSNLVANLQALLMAGKEGMYNRESAENISLGVQDANMTALRSLSHQKMSSFAAQTPGIKREVTGSLNALQGGVVGNKAYPFHNDYATKEYNGLGRQPDYFQTCRPFSSPFNPQTPSEIKEASKFKGQTKLPTKPSISSPLSHSVAEFAPLVSSQQMQRATSRAHSGQDDGAGLRGRISHPGLALGLDGLKKVGTGGEGGYNVPLAKGWMQTGTSSGLMADSHSPQSCGSKPKTPVGSLLERDRKQGLQQIVYTSQANMYPGQAEHIRAHSVQAKPVLSQVLPYPYQMRDSQKNQFPMFSSCPTLPYGGTVPPRDIGELLADREVQALNLYMQELVGQTLPSMMSSKLSNSHAASVTQLHFYLEVCSEQWKMLEKERKTAEAVLMKSFPGKYVSLACSFSLPKMPPNPSRLDRLIADQLQEQTKLASLLGKMEHLRSFPLSVNICSVLDRHLEAIYLAQAQLKEECNSSRQRQGPAYFREDRDILMVSALQDLSSWTRKSRTALWCALHMTLAKTDTDSEDEEKGEACAPSEYVLL